MANKKPPSDLQEPGAAYWRTIQRGWKLDMHQPALLHRACRALDIIADAEKELSITGLSVTDRFGQHKPAPAVGVIRDMTGLFSRLVRELGLGNALEAERPPALANRYRGRR
jgi:phage terminase small subunit